MLPDGAQWCPPTTSRPRDGCDDVAVNDATTEVEPTKSVPALALHDVHLRRDGTTILGSISATVETDEHWVILGANGCGKTSLMRIMALYDHPSSGVVEVLGERLGTTDIRMLRRHVGYAAAALAEQLPAGVSGLDVVKTAKNAALAPWWHQYTDDDHDRARWCLDQLGVLGHADRRFSSLSSGEQQRVLLSRTLMNDPAVVLLDEPSARLDLGGREDLVASLRDLAQRPDGPAMVVVTHHVDEIPSGITHAMLMRDGGVLASGPLDDTLTAEALSECFGLALVVERRRSGRFSAWARD